MSSRTPHYAMPNTSFVLPQYANAEAELINQAFTSVSFRRINHLPNEMKPNYVNEARANIIDDNYTSSVSHAPHGSYRKVGGRKLFMEFEYMSDPYDMVDKIRDQELQKHKIMTTGKKEFKFASARPQPLKRSIGHGEKSSVEMEKQKEALSTIKDPYEGANDELHRKRWLEKQKILFGPFKPAKNEHSMRRKTHGHIPDIIMSLAKELDADWGDCEFELYCDPEDLIVMEFGLDSLDSPDGLGAYMNTMVRCNPIISEYGLSKVVELWNHRPGDGSVYYAYRPPWVRRKKLEAFYCLHPEKRRYRTQISDDGEVTQDFDTHDGGDNSNDNNDRSALGGGDMGNKGYDHDE